MHEARIEVTEEGADYRVRLLDVTNGDVELATGVTAASRLEGGFSDLTHGGAPITAKVVTDDFAKESIDAKKFGDYLYRLLTPEPAENEKSIESEWDALRDAHSGDGDSLTTLLELTPDLWERLPWELTYRKSQTRFLFQDLRHAMGLCRPAGGVNAVTCNWPLRMLVIVGDTGDDDDAIEWREELLGIRRAMCCFSLHVDMRVIDFPLSPIAAGKIFEEFRPHLFHFIGHGVSDGEGALLLRQEDGTTKKWETGDLVHTLSALTPASKPRFAFFNACESAGADGVFGLSSVAAALARDHCPAVIAMRGKIGGDTARIFAQSFYSNLAKRGINRVDQAFAGALGDSRKQPDWMLPRIYYQHTASAVLSMEGHSLGFDQATKGYNDLKELKPFVDREPLRLELYHKVSNWLNDESPAHRVLLVRGKYDGKYRAGRTWFVKALVYVASLRGYLTSYLNPNHPEPRTMGLKDVLHQLRTGSGDVGSFFGRSPFADPGDSNPFADFDKSMAGDQQESDANLNTLRANKFAEGLTTFAKDKRVLVALDHIGNLQPGWPDILKEIILPVQQGDLGSGVRMVIAVSEEELEAYNKVSNTELKSLEYGTIELKPLPPEDFTKYFLQYLLYHLDVEPGDDEISLLKESDRTSQDFGRHQKITWNIQALNKMFSILKNMQ